MNIDTRARTQNRKRERQGNLDLSIPSVLPKIRKTDSVKTKMPKSTDQPNNAHFVDLSHTINQPANTRRDSVVNNPSVCRDEDLTPEVRNLVSDEVTKIQSSLEDKVKELVRNEMSETRKILEQLTRSLVNLTGGTTVVTNTGGSDQVETDSGNPMESENSSNNGSRNGIPIQPQSNADNNRQLLLPVQSRIHPVFNGQNLELPRIRVDKLGINFDGNPANINIDDFVFRLEHLQRHYQIPWSEVLRDFHLLMTGSAREWYWLYVKTHGVVDWPGLRHALLAQFQVSRSNFEIMRDLVERRQQIGESVDEYFQAMCKIRARLIQPIPEYDLIKIIKRNIKESIGRVVYPIAVSSVEQLRVECNEAEKHFPRREARPLLPMTRQNKYLNEIFVDDIESCAEPISQADNYEEVCAININTQQRKQPLVCWNCKQQGHVYMDCTSTERFLFCYKCGRPNVITPRCPNCQSGNQLRGLATKGDPGSSANQTPNLN